MAKLVKFEDYTFLGALFPAESCYLREALLWRAFARLPEAMFIDEEDWRFSLYERGKKNEKRGQGKTGGKRGHSVIELGSSPWKNGKNGDRKNGDSIQFTLVQPAGAAFEVRAVVFTVDPELTAANDLRCHAGWLGTRLESLQNNGAIPCPCQQTGIAVDAHEADAFRGAERNGVGVTNGGLEEISHNRSRDAAAGGAAPHGFGAVKANKDANREICREADEPGILLLVGGSGLAANRLADGADRAAGSA